MEEKARERYMTAVRRMIEDGRYDNAYGIITEGMKAEPDSAAWHNLLGILYEKQGNHTGGMKHFRAAWALEPTFLPASRNMDMYGSFGKGIDRTVRISKDEVVFA